MVVADTIQHHGSYLFFNLFPATFLLWLKMRSLVKRSGKL